MESFLKIDWLYKAAYEAHRGTSFSPEVRAEQYVKSYEQQLNEDLNNMPEEEKQRYIDGYKKHLFAWLSAKSRCLSSMITGPSNFPVRRNEKANNSEHNRSVEFTEWRENALKYIAKRKEDSKPQEVKDSERWLKIKKGLESSVLTIISIDKGINTYSARSLFVSSISGVIKTLAKNGETELVKKSLDLITYWNEQSEKPVITAKNNIWTLIHVAEIVQEKEVDKETAENKEYEINGVKVIENIKADRIQLFFDGKPEYKVISELKHLAFKWSPYNGCWQRQLTRNAIYAAESLLKNIS